MQLVKVLQVFEGYSLCGTFLAFNFFFNFWAVGVTVKDWEKWGLPKQAKPRCAIALKKETFLSALIIFNSN